MVVMPDFSTQSIYAVFAETAERRRDHAAVIYLGSRYSYGRVKELAEAFAAGLAGLGLTAGSKVMLYIPTASNGWWPGSASSDSERWPCRSRRSTPPTTSSTSPTTAAPKPSSAPTPTSAT